MLYISIVCSSILLSNIILYEYSTIGLSIHLPVDIWVCFQVGTIINKAAVNICIQVFLWVGQLFNMSEFQCSLEDDTDHL